MNQYRHAASRAKSATQPSQLKGIFVRTRYLRRLDICFLTVCVLHMAITTAHLGIMAHIMMSAVCAGYIAIIVLALRKWKAAIRGWKTKISYEAIIHVIALALFAMLNVTQQLFILVYGYEAWIAG